MLRRLALIILTSIPIYSQSYTGSISGRVVDSTGSVMPQVSVVVKETGTNTTTRTVSNDVGDYFVSFLNPGTYSLSFSKAGFKMQVQNGLALQLNQALRVDMTMQVGAVNEQVEV